MVLVKGKAVTTLPVLLLKVEDGLQLYTEDPFAVKVADAPAHIEAVCGETVITGIAFTNTVAVMVLLQIPLVPVTV